MSCDIKNKWKSLCLQNANGHAAQPDYLHQLLSVRTHIVLLQKMTLADKTSLLGLIKRPSMHFTADKQIQQEKNIQGFHPWFWETKVKSGPSQPFGEHCAHLRTGEMMKHGETAVTSPDGKETRAVRQSDRL